MQEFVTTTLALSGSLVAISVFKPIAPRLGLIDTPRGRKTHSGVIPLIGGIAIWLVFSVTLLLMSLPGQSLQMIAIGGLLVLVGAMDDVFDLPAKPRLALQCLAAVLMCLAAGVTASSLGELAMPGIPIELGWFAIPFTVFATVSLMNAVNLADGMDGLAGTQLLIPFAALALITGIKGDAAHFVILLTVCAGLLGFLAFNLRTPWRTKAAVFMGDAGTNFLGLLLAWFLIDLSQGADAILDPVSVLWFAPLLIFDTVEVVVRRVRRGDSPLQPNREHLHDVFILAGFSVSQTVIAMGAIALVGSSFGVLAAFVDIPEWLQFWMFLAFGLLFLNFILRTWSAARFLYRSICRRREDRRRTITSAWSGPDRRTGRDRRRRAASSGQGRS